uniref:Uncharacterized protein n=1 Tax=uncultured Caudovirales phage TaxID=2100421 RepID=A0A6J5L4C4_9CAUD|nr:hypothetical protein UFOVP114_50 [uncultured Caudovirales phage]
MAEQYRAFSGVRAKLRFEGNLEAGWMTGLSGEEVINNVRVDVCGDILTQEIEPTGYTVSFNANFVRILRRSLKKMGIWPGKIDTATIVNWPAMSADVYDSLDPNAAPIHRVIGLKPASRSFNVDRNGLMTTNSRWEGIMLYDEDGAAGA